MYNIMKKKTVIPIATIYMLLLLVSFIPITYLNASSPDPSLNILILGDPVANTSYVELDLRFDKPTSGIIDIPLVIDGTNIAIINVTGVTSTNNLVDLTNATSFDTTTQNIVVVADDIIKIAIKILVYGIFDVEGIDSYFLNVNLTRISNDISLSCELRIMGNYTPIIVSIGGYSIEKKPNMLIIRFSDKTNYFITIYPELSENILPPIVETTTTTNEENTGVIATSNNNFLLYIIALLTVAIVVALVYFFLKRSRAVVIEELSSKDLLSDDVIRNIIVAIGKTGDKGIVQARLPEILGKPKSTISRKIKRLSEEGYVNVIRKGKINILKLTEKGWKAYKKIAEE
ncbi:hypothetical protein J4526_09595 [Desulfurococcaceae archaeon MEX13E-LK6-19]|nr:hypothetical protein J4526_09595 [Desulfurococcaceae archaeon MEX13E-LK6-19]